MGYRQIQRAAWRALRETPDRGAPSGLTGARRIGDEVPGPILKTVPRYFPADSTPAAQIVRKCKALSADRAYLRIFNELYTRGDSRTLQFEGTAKPRQTCL